jgi:hypothetical protein
MSIDKIVTLAACFVSFGIGHPIPHAASMAVGSPTTPPSYVNGPCGVDSHRVPTITAEDQLKTLTPGAYFCAPDGKVHIYYPHAGHPPTTATTNTPAEPQKMVDLVASVVLAVIFIPIMIAFLLAAAWFWCALFMGTPFTYSMLQGIWLRCRTSHSQIADPSEATEPPDEDKPVPLDSRRGRPRILTSPTPTSAARSRPLMVGLET